jgi:hypothetical protein
VRVKLGSYLGQPLLVTHAIAIVLFFLPNWTPIIFFKIAIWSVNNALL